MKKFKLYATVFAALCFAASCQDDVIDSSQGQGNSGDGTPAYLTVSFTANSGSSTRSTADDANNQGDTDGNQEDSGHQNSGTENERAVDKVLVVITPANGGNVNFAKLYSTATSQTANSDDSGTFDVKNQTEGAQYTNDKPIELTTGQYNVLVVANPVDELLTGITTDDDLNTGIYNSNVAENLYTRITTGNYLPEETEWNYIASGTAPTSQSFRIMMANKALSTTTGQNYTVELKAENTIDKPATATIEIERAYSKITFRETKYNNTTANVYEVPLHIGQVKAILVDAAIAESDLDATGASSTPTTYVYKQLNAAWDAQTPTPNEVYVLWETGESGTPECKGVFRAATEEEQQEVAVPNEGGSGTTNKACTVYKKLTPVQKADPQNDFKPEEQYIVDFTGDGQASDHPTDGLVYRSEETGQVENWYIRLEGYALVNLSKNVHYVRHTTDNLGQSPFGTLNGYNYLYTPYWDEKNDDSNFTEDATTGNMIFTGTPPVSETWFYNTLAKVSKESEVLTITDGAGGSGGITFGRSDNNQVEFFKAMPTTDDGSQTVTGGETQHTEGNLPGIGKFMSYCFENSTDIDHQLHGLSTGITFVARIYADAGCSKKISRLYRYDNHLFESLEAIQKSYGANLMSDKFNELVNTEKGGTGITKADIKALAEYKAENEGGKNGEKIDLYADGICYYYTTEIKHFDNGSNTTLGNMEFAIMRNNIYSLAVTSINDIGDPFVDPTPNTPNENTDPITALNVEVKIIPWIVRYNDIEF